MFRISEPRVLGLREFKVKGFSGDEGSGFQGFASHAFGVVGAAAASSSGRRFRVSSLVSTRERRSKACNQTRYLRVIFPENQILVQVFQPSF